MALDVCKRCGDEIPRNTGCPWEFRCDACCIKAGHDHPWLKKPTMIPKEKLDDVIH